MSLALLSDSETMEFEAFNQPRLSLASVALLAASLPPNHTIEIDGDRFRAVIWRYGPIFPSWRVPVSVVELR